MSCLRLFANRTRFLILLLTTICLTLLVCCIIAFNFSIICMKKNTTIEVKYIFNLSQNYNESRMVEEDIYNELEQSFILSSPAYSSIVAVYPIIFLLNRYGVRIMLTSVGLLTAFATFFIPFMVEINIYCVIFLRLFQGIGVATVITVIGTIVSAWSPIAENGIFISILSDYMHLAPIIAMPIAGILCDSSLGWPSIYYFHGFATVIVFIVFAIYYRDNCEDHPCVSKSEYTCIIAEKSNLSSTRNRPPYMAMLRSAPVWAVWFAALGNCFGLQLLLRYTPTYLHKILGYDVLLTGYASAVSQIGAFFIKIFAGIASDRIKFCTETNKVRFFNTISIGGMGICYLILAILPNSEKKLCFLAITLANFCIAFNGVGFFKSAQLIAQHHTHFIMGNISFMVCITWLIVPFIVQLFAPNNQPNEWSNVFIFHAVLMIAMNLIFCLFASGKPEKWALVDVTNINSLAPSDRKKHSKTKIYAIDKNVQIRRMENEKELDKV